MLIKTKFRIPDVFLGMMLAIALFVLGVLFASPYSGQPTQEDGGTKATQTNANRKPDKFSWNWFAEDPVGFFTLCLVAVGLFQVGLFYVQLHLIRKGLTPAQQAADAAKAASVHIPTVERAYVSGGAMRLMAKPEEFRCAINNYGKTPAFIGTVQMHISPIEGLKPTPHFLNDGEFKGYVLKPDTQSFISDVASFYNTTTKRSAVYGRIYYRDIFNKCHSAGFILEIRDDGLPALPGYPAYWEDRPECNLGPAAPEGYQSHKNATQ